MVAGIPAIVWFAEHSFAEAVKEHAVRMQVEFLTGNSYDAFMLLGCDDFNF